MRRLILTGITWIANLALIGLAAIADEPPKKPAGHQWQQITYPPIPSPKDDGQEFTVVVGSGHGDEKRHLRFDILWSGLAEGGPPAFLGDADKITVRLHMPDGKVIEPNPDSGFGWVGVGGSFGVTWSVMYTFPCGRNLLEEAWFELRSMGTAHWIEVPYGFTCDPDDPLAPARQDVNGPAFAPAMMKLAKGDRIVAWNSVVYDVGTIAGKFRFGDKELDRRLTVSQSNPFDAACRLSLYGVDDLHDPRTSVEIEQNADHRVVGRCVSLAFREGTLSRIDKFKFNRNPTDGRDWGKLKIIVGEEAYFVVMPSSLFYYVHGVSDRRHSALIRSREQDR